MLCPSRGWTGAPSSAAPGSLCPWRRGAGGKGQCPAPGLPAPEVRSGGERRGRGDSFFQGAPGSSCTHSGTVAGVWADTVPGGNATSSFLNRLSSWRNGCKCSKLHQPRAGVTKGCKCAARREVPGPPPPSAGQRGDKPVVAPHSAGSKPGLSWRVTAVRGDSPRFVDSGCNRSRHRASTSVDPHSCSSQGLCSLPPCDAGRGLTPLWQLGCSRGGRRLRAWATPARPPPPAGLAPAPNAPAFPVGASPAPWTALAAFPRAAPPHSPPQPRETRRPEGSSFAP